MAEKIVIQLDLESGDAQAFKSTLEQIANKSAEDTAKKFSSNFGKNLKANIANTASELNVSLGNIATTALKATSALASVAAGFIAFKSIDAAQVQQDAINNLNNALQTAGDFSLAASESLQSFASELQNVTRFGDEVILNQIALAKSFGATNEQAKQIVTAAADLSAAFGIDLGSATRNVAKTLGGLAGELGETIPELKALGEEGLKAGRGIDLISQRFSGSAVRDVQTYSGALDQLKNAFGDTLESIGRTITQSPQLVNVFKVITDSLVSVTKQIDEFTKSFDLFSEVGNSLVEFNDIFIKFVVAPFELLANVADLAQKGVNASFSRIISGVGNLGFAVAKVLDTLGVGEGLSQQLKDFEETSEQVADDVSKNLFESFNSALDFPLADTLSVKNEELKKFIDEQNEIVRQGVQQRREIASTEAATAIQTTQTLSDVFSNVSAGFQSGVDGIITSTAQANAKVAEFAKSAGKQLQVGFANAAGQAFSSFGRAIASGENALEAFTKSLFKAIADQAVALGTRFILEGTAYLFSPGFQSLGPPLIAAGAGLAAFGGALGAVAGGGGGAAAGAGQQGAGVTAPGFGDVASPEAEQERRDPSTNVQVVVQGSLVQQQELGQFITETLNESFSKQGVTLTDARIS